MSEYQIVSLIGLVGFLALIVPSVFGRGLAWRRLAAYSVFWAGTLAMAYLLVNNLTRPPI